jgi:hypothetical protein
MKKIFIQVMLLIATVFTVCSSFSQVTVYSERNFRGTSRLFAEPGDFTITFDIKSIHITPGYIVVLSENRDRGSCQYWRSVSGDAVLGYQNYGIKIIRADASDASLQVMINTGGDDLRKGSKATLTIATNIPGGNRIIALDGSEDGISNNTPKTFTLPITGLRIDQILNLTLSYESGSSGVPFETTDNWNVNTLIIVYRSNRTYPDGLLLHNRSGNPLVRFTGARKRYSAPVRGSVFNDVLFEF